ncbi:MAG: 23S rRNA (uracil(1939)-C(5))-methyltransferase RlmD [Ignavibacteria bacterium]
MKKGDLIELEITGYAFEGKGISKINLENTDKKFTIFVNNSYPGDKVKAVIKKKKSSYAEAKVEELIDRSNQRVKAECKYFGTCGGCKQQDLDYSFQLKYKEEQVKEIFERIGGISNFEFLPIIPSENIFFYRNKMEYSFSDKRWLTKGEISHNNEVADRNFALGLHIPRIFDKVLDIDECFLQSEISNKILNFTRDFFKNRYSTIYSTKTHTGYLRNLVIKSGFKTKDLMVNLVTSENNEHLFIEYSNGLVNEIPSITTVINSINEKKANVAIGDYEKVYFGEGFIYDIIGGYKFRISGNSFFQTNTLQAEKLYQTALDFSELKGNEIVYDLYSGAGTISIFISENAEKIYGFESVESAVTDTAINCKLNNIYNVKAFQADLNKSFLPIIEKNKIEKPTLIIADPPRSGMNPKTVNDIIKLKPEKLTYISCNPATQARDIKILVENGFKLKKMRPVDMFPHTYHIENVALLIQV